MRRRLLCASAMLLAGALAVAAAAPAWSAPPQPDRAGAAGLAPAATTEDGRLRIAIIVPLTVPASSDGLITAARLAEYTGDDGVLTRRLDAADDRAVTLAVDPRIVASIRVLGAAAPPSALAWLERLEATDDDVMALGYADADPVAAIEADGTTAAMVPLGFDGELDPAAFAPDGDAGSDLPALPDGVEAITALPTTVDGVVWPSDGLVASDLPVLGAQGVEHVVVGATAVSGTGPLIATTEDGPDLVVADAAIGAAMRDAIGADPATAAATLDALRAAIASAAAAPGSSLRVVALDRVGAGAPDRLAAVLAALASDATVRLVGLPDVVDEPPASGALIDEPQSDTRRAAVAELLRAERSDTAFAAVADEPALLTSPARLRLLALLSAAWGDGAVWRAAVADSLQATSDRIGAVEIVHGDPVLQISPQSQLQVPVRNNLDVPITVYATARALQTQLVIDPGELPVAIPVQANSTATGLIPVEAVASGRVSVEVTIADARGATVAAPVLVSVDAQPGWETIGVFVAGGIVLAAFGVGLVRAILRRRRQLDETGDDPDDGSDDGSGGTGTDADAAPVGPDGRAAG